MLETGWLAGWVLETGWWLVAPRGFQSAVKVATELSSVNYGPVEWWLLLEPVPQGSS